MLIPGARAIFRIVVASVLLVSFRMAAGTIAASEVLPEGAPAGTWIGIARTNGHEIPFRLEISGAGGQIHGALLNGREKSTSSSGSYSNGHLVLHFDYYANTLDARIQGGTLSGTFAGHVHSVPITAQLNGKLPIPAANPPTVAGVWNVAVDNGSKGEDSWKLRIRQRGPYVDAVIERIDGDTGNLYGVWRDGVFAVSHFTAAGPSFAVLRPQPDGTLQLETAAHGGGLHTYLAQRASSARPVALKTADDPMRHTFLKNPDEPLAFRFPDLNGNLVSNTDRRFAHRVLIVSIGGSWCPNCQDEAPFLEDLYRKYHSRGLDIVELSFEEASQIQNPLRLKAVIQRYGITFPVLVAGTPDQLNEKFPYVANLNCWPTTFFVGRDGLVKAIHTGYEGPATGGDNRRVENEMTALVERLLAGQGSSQRSKAVQVAQSQ